MAAEDKDLNRDPITDEPGAHPVGTGVGAAGGAVAGAAAGSMGGPVGVAVGGVVGAVVGGLAGKAAAEAVNPTAEEATGARTKPRAVLRAGPQLRRLRPGLSPGPDGRTRYEDWDSAEPSLASEWESHPRRLQPELAPGTAGQPRGVGPHRVESHGRQPGMGGTADSRMGRPESKPESEPGCRRAWWAKPRAPAT